jgi:hypothetical protein
MEDKYDHDLIPCHPNKDKGMVMTTLVLSRSNKVEVTIISHPLFPREGRKCDHDIPPPEVTPSLHRVLYQSSHMNEDKYDHGLIPCPPNKEKGMVMTTLLLSRSWKIEVTMTSLPLFSGEGRWKAMTSSPPPPRSHSIPSQNTLPESPNW